MTFAILFLSLYGTIIQGDYQARKIKANRWINHGMEAIAWVVFAGLVCFAVAGVEWMFTDTWEMPVTEWPQTRVQWLGTLPGLRWLVHDLYLNHVRGLKWWYVGTGPRSALLDRVVNWTNKNLGLWAQIVLKLWTAGAGYLLTRWAYAWT